jgi:hypothetical protein
VQRRLCSAILGLEAVVLGLSTLVLVPLSSVSDTAGLTIGLGLLVACVLIAGLLRFRWAFALGWLVQVAALALGFVIGAMFALGAIFLALWATAYLLGRRIETDRAAWEARARQDRGAH